MHFKKIRNKADNQELCYGFDSTGQMWAVDKHKRYISLHWADYSLESYENWEVVSEGEPTPGEHTYMFWNLDHQPRIWHAMQELIDAGHHVVVWTDEEHVYDDLFADFIAQRGEAELDAIIMRKTCSGAEATKRLDEWKRHI